MSGTKLLEGQEILDGRFKIKKKLGSGAFGEIYKVEKKKSGDMYAAKVEKANNKRILNNGPIFSRNFPAILEAK